MGETLADRSRDEKSLSNEKREKRRVQRRSQGTDHQSDCKMASRYDRTRLLGALLIASGAMGNLSKQRQFKQLANYQSDGEGSKRDRL